MVRARRSLPVLVVVLWAGVAHAQPGPAEQALGAFLGHRALRGAGVSVLVTDLESGEVLLERGSRRPRIPASSQKLVVAAAALEHWGPTHRFETPVLIDGPLDSDGVVHGALWVAGRGDPGLVSESLWKLAEEIRLLGVRHIEGGLGIDPGFFDAMSTHPDWEPLTRRAYEAPTGAFVVNYSSFRIEVSPGERPGDLASVAIAPYVSYFRVRSDGVTLPQGSRVQLDLEPLPDGSGERVLVSGGLSAADGPRTYWRSVSLPGRYAAALLRAQLEAQGIRVSGSIRFGRVPTGAVELLRFKGESLGILVRRLNKWSNNFIAEQLTKALGAELHGPPGRWQTGVAVLRDHLRRIGVPSEQFVIADGSGLSPRNRISAAALVTVVRAAASAFGSGPEFLASLPLGGLDGTLRDRMEGGAVALRGKTGHLSHVSSMTGVLAAPDGQRRAFAVLVNGARGGRVEVDAAMDAFISGLFPPPPDDHSPSDE